MKKTKIIIGAFIMLSLFGANAFAQNESFPMENEPPSYTWLAPGDFAKIKDGLVSIFEKIKQEQEENGSSIFYHTKDIYMGERFIAEENSQVFKILLMKRFKNIKIKPENQTWKENGLEFKVSVEYPYLYIQVNNYTSNKNIPMIVMSHNVSNLLALGVSLRKLDLLYEINGQVFIKELGALSNIPGSSPISVDISFDQDLKVQNGIAGILKTDIKYSKANSSFFFKDRYFGFYAYSIKKGELKIGLSNQNPLLETVTAKIIKENNNIYCVYTLKDKSGQEETHKIIFVKDGVFVKQLK